MALVEVDVGRSVQVGCYLLLKLDVVWEEVII